MVTDAGIGYAVHMENRTQPILCCVGADVAGEPTQFLMERAAIAGHLDWHVITVDVSSDQLTKAWEGMNVMRFQAVRFFSTHQMDAMRLVAEPSAEDAFIGGITSAMRVGDQWTMWHNTGPALVELTSARVVWDKAIVWVYGSTPQTRSFLVACHTKTPRKIYWIPGARSTVSQDPLAADELMPDSIKNLPLVIVSAENETETLSTLMASAEEANSISAVVHIGEMDSRRLDLILANQPEQECALAIVSAAPGLRRKLNDAWRAGESSVISPADIVVAEEAYDQARWTGQPANIELLREAYEEYADF